jgi:hypothetical protein
LLKILLDKLKKAHIIMSILNIITSWMKQVDVSGHYTPMPDIPDDKLQKIRFLINSKFQKDYSLEEVSQLLYLEGLAPDLEYVPQWYLEKYYPSKKS